MVWVSPYPSQIVSSGQWPLFLNCGPDAHREGRMIPCPSATLPQYKNSSIQETLSTRGAVNSPVASFIIRPWRTKPPYLKHSCVIHSRKLLHHWAAWNANPAHISVWSHASNHFSPDGARTPFHHPSFANYISVQILWATKAHCFVNFC